MQLSDFLTCAYINFSKHKYSFVKNKEISAVNQNQRSYCFMDLQKVVYPQQFQQAIEIVVLLFSSHTGFVLESELKYSNKFLGATMQMTFTFSFPTGLLSDHPEPLSFLSPQSPLWSIQQLTFISSTLLHVWFLLSYMVRELHFPLTPGLNFANTAAICLMFLSRVAHSPLTSRAEGIQYKLKVWVSNYSLIKPPSLVLIRFNHERFEHKMVLKMPPQAKEDRILPYFSFLVPHLGLCLKEQTDLDLQFW